MKQKQKYSVYLDSLGCCKNLVDSELALGLLIDSGFEYTDNPAAATVIMVNTCGFIGDAKEESIERILELAQYKYERCRVLAVTGCLSQKYRDELWQELPEVDVMLGVDEYQLLPAQILSILEQRIGMAEAVLDYETAIKKRLRLTPAYSAYLKIAEGCNNHCSFCAIPGIRGALRSRRIEDIVAEAEQLLADGVQELILIAQDTTAYGQDIYGRFALAELLAAVAELDFPWIRILYCYPERITDELLKVMAEHSNICHYLDIPIQHSAPQVLQRMGRKYDEAALGELFGRIKSYLPDCVIRTTFMVGFPGETEADFAELLRFVEKNELAWAGCFIYSPEDGTPAADFPEQVPDELKLKRYNQLVGALGLRSREHKENWKGQVLPILLEGESADLPGYFQGRSPYHAPDVDGIVYVDNRSGKLSAADVGYIVKVKIHTVETYDVIGEPVE